MQEARDCVSEVGLIGLSLFYGRGPELIEEGRRERNMKCRGEKKKGGRKVEEFNRLKTICSCGEHVIY